MAEAWHASGPTTIQVKTTYTDGSWSTFGRTNNEELAKFEVEDLHRDFTRNDLGDQVAEFIVTGSRCFVEIVLESWDETLFEELIARTRLTATTSASANEGKHGIVGKLGVTDNMIFGLKILTSRSGERSFSFPRCRFAAPVRKEEFGNVMVKLRLLVEALPDGSGVIYTASTNS